MQGRALSATKEVADFNPHIACCLNSRVPTHSLDRCLREDNPSWYLEPYG